MSENRAWALLSLLLQLCGLLASGVVLGAQRHRFGRGSPRLYNLRHIPRLNFLRHVLEQLLDARSIFGTGLHEGRESIVFCELFPLAIGHLDLLEQVRFVAHECDVAVLRGILPHGGQPIYRHLHRVATRHIIHDYSPGGPIEIIPGDMSQSFVASRVPQLELDLGFALLRVFGHFNLGEGPAYGAL